MSYDPVMVECCACGYWDDILLNKFDLHEIIVSRGAASGFTSRGRLMIHDTRNCGFVHRECHAYAEGGYGRIAGIKYLIQYNGLDNTLAFLAELRPFAKADSTIEDFERDVRKAYSLLR